ncbi:MAG: aldehyde dehydrogenase family protein, partial [Nocardioidaceae bacterium]
MESRLRSVIGSDAAGGEPAPAGDGAGDYVSRNPADLDDVVARVELGGPETLRVAAAGAKRAQRAWARVPAPVRGRVVAALGRLVEANKSALARLVT